MSPSKVSINKILFILLKTAVSLLSLAFIYSQIVSRENFETFSHFINEKIAGNDATIYLISVSALMFINYGIEALKWKLLIRHLSALHLIKCLQAIFLGTTVSFFTPNRIGEFAGRILFLDARIRIQAILSTFVGSLSQLLVTVLLGLASMALFATHYVQVTSLQQLFLILFTLLLMVFLLWVFPRVKNIFSSSIFAAIKNKYPQYLAAFENYSQRDLWTIFALSLLRYLIFTFQYILLLQLCGIDLPLIIFAATISILFFIQALIPTIAFTELAFRGSLAIVVFGKFTTAVNGIIIASFGLWLVNLAIPAAIGSLMFLYLKLKNKNSEAS